MANVGDKIDAGGGRSYELLLELGRGGMGRVYLARVSGLGGFQRLVALKTCHPHLADEQDFSRMFLQEARTAGQIGHPNVVSVIDVGQSGQELYLVMDYLEGIGLSNLLKQLKRQERLLPLEVALRIALDTLAGLHAAHELTNLEGVHQGLVHRDISPANILVGLDGCARVLDFGIAKVAASSQVTRQGHIKGKLGYLAPEQFSDGGIDRRTDLYAMGVTLWEMLAGDTLYANKTDKETISSILSGSRPELDEIRNDLPSGLMEVLDKSLEAEPDERFSSADEFAAALESLGVRAASAREVAEFVKPMCAAELEHRREQIKSAPCPADEPLSQQDATLASRWMFVAVAALLVLAGAGWFVFDALTDPSRTTAAPVEPIANTASLAEFELPAAFENDASKESQRVPAVAFVDAGLVDAQVDDVASPAQSSDSPVHVRRKKRTRPVRRTRRKKKEFFPTGL